MSKKQYWNGHEVLFQSHLFGKEYFFMKDPHDGLIWLAQAEPVVEVSVDAEGNGTPFISGYRPKVII